MVDGILELTNELAGLNTIRHLQVRKMRGTDQVVGKHNFEIRDEGVVLHPRMETQLQAAGQGSDAIGNSDVRMPFGIARLDRMLSGGLPEASMTMVVGPTGTGKTLLAMQFLCEGARRGERGLLFGFFERPEALAHKARRLGLPFQEYVDQGLIEVIWQRPVEAIIDALAGHLFERVREGQIKRLVIDSLQGFQRSLDDYPERMRGVFAAMADELERQKVTTLYTIETREVFGPRIEVPIEGVSAVTHNTILLRHVELHSRLRLMLTVLKIRDSGHDRTVRELIITDEGLQVADAVSETPHILSASSLQPASSLEPKPKRTKTEPTGRSKKPKKRKR
jgi:circadian clock protein KaiC